MESNNEFTDEFRRKIFDEIKLVGAGVSNNLIGIVQNRMPLDDDMVNLFNTQIDDYLDRLNVIKDKINSEYSRLL